MSNEITQFDLKKSLILLPHIYKCFLYTSLLSAFVSKNTRIIKELAPTDLQIVLFIFNVTLCDIPKAGTDPTQTKSYRPISLLSILSKKFESLLPWKISPVSFK